LNTGRFDTQYPVFNPPIPLDSSPYPRLSVRKLPDSHSLIEKLPGERVQGVDFAMTASAITPGMSTGEAKRMLWFLPRS
jgi:hypothetical protein